MVRATSRATGADHRDRQIQESCAVGALLASIPHRFDLMVGGRRISADDDGTRRIGSANDAGRTPNLLMRNEKRTGFQRATC
jgi:hypothetical protein